MSQETHPFYGKQIVRREQNELIEEMVKKFRHLPANEELKGKIWEELQLAKYRGEITIPFQVALRRNPPGDFPDYIEIILDTKV